MASLNPESDTFENKPIFYIGQHDSNRSEALSDDQYNQVLDSGVSLNSLQKYTISLNMASS